MAKGCRMAIIGAAILTAVPNEDQEFLFRLGPKAGNLEVRMNNLNTLGLHDAELIELAIDQADARVTLNFKLENGTLRQAKIQGLRAFRGADLTFQNVVSRVLRASRGEIAREDLDRWLTWGTSLSDTSSRLSDQCRSEWIDAFAAGTLELVVFEPSAGAEIVAVCDRFDVS